jgi:aspartate kinase
MIIQKFGGVAMQNEEMRMKCINHIKDGIEQFKKIVVVVSAIGRLGDPYATDSLLNLSKAFSSDKAAKDLVASCGELIAASVLSAELHQFGIGNKILHGMQAGIVTSGEYGDASILTIDTTTIHHYLHEVDCIIIPGFQGMDEKGNIMTLGRGGSDLTAVALADALQATHVQFFKDVPGVMTEDPTIIKSVQKLDSLGFDEFLDFLNCEKPIIQKRAALHAKKTATPLYIRGITGTESGTWINN